MHHIHHTEAFVLGSRPAREDSKVLILYTRELGLVHAYAQGIRKLSSRLRFTLQDFSEAQVDLVRGKDMWRLTTAVPIRSYSSVVTNQSSERIIARISSLLIRLVTGEEANDELFDVISEAYNTLEKADHISEQYRSIELLFVARILITLGYLPVQNLAPELLSDIAFQHRLIRDINQALTETQL